MSRANNDWRQEPEEHEKPKNWEDDHKKPSNWGEQKKNVNTAICSIMAFSFTLSLTVYAAAIPATVTDLSLTGLVATVPYSCFALGLAFGPAFSTPFEKAYGRKPIFLFTVPLFALVMIGAGVSKGLVAIAVCRGLAGIFASAGLFLSYAIMSDIWVPLRLSIGLAIYIGSMVLGLFAGPIVGGVVIKYETWRWTMWVALFATVILMFGAIGMTETQEAAIKRKIKTPEQIEKEVAERRAKRVTRQPSRLHFFGNFMFAKSFSMLLAAPSLSMATLYVSYVLAVSIAMPVFVPGIFGALYSFDVEQQNLTFAGAAGGVVVGVLLIIVLDHFIHQPRKDNKPLAPPAEWRWLPALAASLLFPGGLLLFAWTTRESINWIIPCIGLALSGVGACLIAFSAITYMMELHEEGDEAIGARAGATMLTFVLGAALPLVVKPMFDALGERIGVTIFAAVAAGLGVVPWVLTYRGNKLVPKEGEVTDEKK
ncbi:major facilitator superfamily domain-containing protein [Elsinoe ampelina]|uniref:Major facilitator superfamily domain-containing protein n=1 Tax=Elsinoe ampelina TaxID=302913 RepID=A0A6A6GPR2_9PEZI|nr:major facilitator superfamily domain-containing protein [Elsinoe ampelina]